MVTLRERFEMAVAKGELDNARRFAEMLEDQYPHLAKHTDLALEALEAGDLRLAWSHAVDARG